MERVGVEVGGGWGCFLFARDGSQNATDLLLNFSLTLEPLIP